MMAVTGEETTPRSRKFNWLDKRGVLSILGIGHHYLILVHVSQEGGEYYVHKAGRVV
jgi:hypothetical protein